jgi:D-glycero-alpha-D-manno-heptose-7-phosphate kinase
MKIVATAPCRIDLAGGTIDIWPLYLFHSGAVTVNFAVNLQASCTLVPRDDHRISLRSEDLDAEESFRSLNQLREARRYRLPLAGRLLGFFAPPAGLDLITDSDSPAGAGLAGSSALMVAVAGALERLTGSRFGREQLREIVQNVEAQIIRAPTGCQDYYPALYGGVNAVELGPGGIRRRPLAVDVQELGERIVLAYTGAPRASGINNWEVIKAHLNGDRRVHRNFDEIAAIARAMVSALESGDWIETGRLLRQEWAHRRRNSPGITTPLIDGLTHLALRRGALGAKVCGAGGGGCVVFLVEREAKQRVSEAVAAAGARVIPARVSLSGLRVRTMPQ